MSSCTPVSQPPLSGGAKRKSVKKSSVKKSSVKKSSVKKSSVKKSSVKKSSVKKSSKMRGGSNELLDGTKIPLRVQSTTGWHMPNTSQIPYSIDLGEAMQSYLFGRPTPDGKDFMVASGMVENGKNDISLVGGAKKKKRSTTKKRRITKKKRTTKKKSATKKRSTTKKKRSTKK